MGLELQLSYLCFYLDFDSVRKFLGVRPACDDQSMMGSKTGASARLIVANGYCFERFGPRLIVSSLQSLGFWSLSFDYGSSLMTCDRYDYQVLGASWLGRNYCCEHYECVAGVPG